MSRTLLAVVAALACARAAEAAPTAPVERNGVPSVADLDAAARAAGNRPREAYRLGQTLFATVWPAQIMKVRVDGAGKHEIAGLVISGVKFHRALDAAAFADQVVRLVQETFAASPVEEVDVWTTVPLPIDKIAAKRLVVSGEEVEADRIVIEALREPLLHLVRNAVDHGLENEAVRVAAGNTACT